MKKENKIKLYENLVKEFMEILPEKEKYCVETFEDMRKAMLDCPMMTAGEVG